MQRPHCSHRHAYVLGAVFQGKRRPSLLPAASNYTLALKLG